MSDSLSLGGGPYHFFDSSSFKAALSSIDSAKSFFSLRFSSSRARSRLVSDTSRPPYLAFQLYSVASHHSRLGHFYWRGHPHDEGRTGGERRSRGDGGVDLHARMGSFAR